MGDRVPLYKTNKVGQNDWRLRSRPMTMEDLNNTRAPLTADGVEEIYPTDKTMEDLKIRVPQTVFGDETPKSGTFQTPGPAQPLVGPEGIAAPGMPKREVPNLTEKARKEGRMGGKTRRNRSSGGDIVSHLLTIRNQVKLYHWQTGSFARHKATDDLTAALDLNIDAFVESYMGRYGRPKVSGSIKLHNFSESAARAFVAKETKYLQQELPRKIGKGDRDLLNLRDTILGDLTKVLYLFTLH